MTKYNIDKIKNEANYCLNCLMKPCASKGCPISNEIPEFIKAIKEENYKEAYEILTNTTVLQPICGRICPHMKQCQGSCVRGIKGNPVSIGELEAFVGDLAIEEGYSLGTPEESNGKKVAVVGGGPAGLTCAAFLAKKGYEITIYEKYDYLGGLLVHGIPEFRLPKVIVKDTVNKILDLGVKVEYRKELGKNLNISDLEKDYDAVFLGIGANVSQKMGVLGEDKKGVFGGNELLEHNLHPDYVGKKVAVIGGGNVAMDCARTIKEKGAQEVYVIYRRAREQMPAEQKEVEEAMEEGVNFLFQNNIVKIIGDSKVEKLELIKTELVMKEGETRAVPVNVENSNYYMDIDYVVMALGSSPEEIVNELGLETNKYNNIVIDENNHTSNQKIFAGGDIAGAKGTVAWAARSGRNAAEAIDRYLSK